MIAEEKEFEDYLRAETSLGRNDALAQFRGVMKRSRALVKAVREDAAKVYWIMECEEPSPEKIYYAILKGKKHMPKTYNCPPAAIRRKGK